jgi:hypothetical protein
MDAVQRNKRGSATDKADAFPEGERHSFYEKMPEVSEYMVADAVDLEPVSSIQFPAKGKLTGNFAKFLRAARFWTPTREQIQRLAAKFPTQQNREFLRRNREFVRSEQGISAAKSLSSPDEVFDRQVL